MGNLCLVYMGNLLGTYSVLFQVDKVAVVVPNPFMHLHRALYLYSPHASCLLGEYSEAESP